MAQKLRKKSWIKLIFFLSYRKMWREHWCYGETRVTNTISRQRNIPDPTYRGESWYLSVDVLACFLIGVFSYYLVKRSLFIAFIYCFRIRTASLCFVSRFFQAGMDLVSGRISTSVSDKMAGWNEWIYYK